MKWVTERSKGHVLSPTDQVKIIEDGQEKHVNVIDVLRQKHPFPRLPHSSTLWCLLGFLTSRIWTSPVVMFTMWPTESRGVWTRGVRFNPLAGYFDLLWISWSSFKGLCCRILIPFGKLSVQLVLDQSITCQPPHCPGQPVFIPLGSRRPSDILSVKSFAY